MIEAQSHTATAVEKMEKTPTVMTVSQILTDLDNGLDRKAIAAKYNITLPQVKAMFEHPVLKGKRPKRATTLLPFTLVDDVTAQQVEDNVAENDGDSFTIDNNFSELND